VRATAQSVRTPGTGPYERLRRETKSKKNAPSNVSRY